MKKRKTAFVNCRLVDGHGEMPSENGMLVVDGSHINYAGNRDDTRLTPEIDVHDLNGLTIMPGLIDAHVHIHGIINMNLINCVLDPPELRAVRATWAAWRILDAGFTAVRDCGNPNALYLKKVIDEGGGPGPRIKACGRIITQTGGHGDTAHSLPIEWARKDGICRIADGPDECRKAAREQIRAGADFIKLCSTGGIMSQRTSPNLTQFTVEEIRAMANEAHSAGLKASSHAQGNQGIKNALRGGVDVIEHGVFLDDEAISMMLNSGTYLVPTLSIVESIAAKGSQVGLPQLHLDKARSILEVHLKSFKKAWKAGVKIGLGTDFLSDPMTPMGRNALELDLYVRTGLSPMDAIVAATRTNAAILGMENELGTLEAGKLADFIVVDGAPDRNIAILQDRSKIKSVYKDGRKQPRIPAEFPALE